MKRIYSSLVDIDNLLMQVQFVLRVEGDYVQIRFRFTRERSFMVFRIKMSTYKSIMRRLRSAEDAVDKKYKGVKNG